VTLHKDRVGDSPVLEELFGWLDATLGGRATIGG
jgi:hypothetical protein